MKATSIVRRIDSLGRIVIPKEVRRTLRIREGDSLEIFIDREGEIIFKKYSHIIELSDFAKEYADCLHKAIGHITFITDREQIIAVAGSPAKEYLHKRISFAVEKIMDERKPVLINETGQRFCYPIFEEEEKKPRYTAEVIAPIVVEGEPMGTVIIASRETNTAFNELELKSAVTAASFLAKQLEQ